MENFNALDRIFGRRKCGYTRAIMRIGPSAKFLIHSEAFRGEFEGLGVVYPNMDLRGTSFPIIPDNHVIYLAINEAKNEFGRLNDKIFSLENELLLSRDANKKAKKKAVKKVTKKLKK